MLRDKGMKLRIGGMVKVRDDVDSGVGTVNFPARGKHSNGSVGLVPMQHGRMVDIHMVHGMDAASLLLCCKHICQAQQLHRLQASRTQYHLGMKLQ